MKKQLFESLVRKIVEETVDVLNEEFQRGEWWIYPGGDVQFADSNIGDSGHEGYVIDHLIREICDHFDINIDELEGALDAYEDRIKESLMEDGNLSPEEQEEWNDESPSEIILRKVVAAGLYKDPKQAEDAVYIAYGSSSRDARDYAMKYLNWKRLDSRSNEAYIQTWFLTSSDIKDISRGLSDIWEEDSEPNEDTTVNIEVRSNNNIYRNIPLEVLDSPNAINKLGDYRVRAAWVNEGIRKGKEWFVYEGNNYVSAIFENGEQISFEMTFRNNTGKDKDKWGKNAASKWMKLAREIHNNPEINEIGNIQQKSWEKCFQEALGNPEMKPFIKDMKMTPVFDPVNFTPRV